MRAIKSPDGRFEIEFYKHAEYMNVEFVVDEPDCKGLAGHEPVLTGNFGYDGCIHIRAPYHHYCEINEVRAVLNLIDAVHKIALSGEIEGYRALR